MSVGCVAIVGSPSVGKSTIFNRIIGEKKSIIEETRGVTRDRIYANASWLTRDFRLIDTGGIELENRPFQEQIRMQAEIAIEEADVILFVVDGKIGLTSDDKLVASMLHKSKKPIVLAVNKIDNSESKNNIYEFYNLGIGDPIAVSGVHGIGIGDILDEIIKKLPNEEHELVNNEIKFCLIGRPNVGKSSLVNAILQEERVIVSSIEGTTRDAIDTKFKYEDEDYVIIDTAGLKKRGKIYEAIDKYAALRALRAIDNSDVCLLVINAEEGIIEHDKHIASYALEAGKAIIIVVNKWDVIEDKDKAMKKFKEEIRAHFQFMTYAPIVFLSALTKKRIHTLMPEILKVYENSRRQIPTNVINDVITDAYALNLPPSYKGKRLKIYFSSQVRTQPPTFNIQVNSKGLIHFSYKRYLENKIREAFDFEGTPIVLQFKNKGEQDL